MKFCRFLPLFFLLAVVFCALAAPLIAPYDPAALIGPFRNPPSADFWLGTDLIGRDVLSRLIHGARVTCGVAAGAALLSTLIGLIAGTVSGMIGGRVDALVMRLTDLFMVFPDVMLLLVLLALFGQGAVKLVVILGCLSWPPTARVIRAFTLSLKEEPYMLYARAAGFSLLRVLVRHLLPALRTPLAVTVTNAVAGAVLSEASLSFLGLGIMPPTPSWGTMLTDAQSLSVLLDSPWIWVPPAVAVLCSLLCLRAVGDRLSGFQHTAVQEHHTER